MERSRRKNQECMDSSEGVSLGSKKNMIDANASNHSNDLRELIRRVEKLERKFDQNEKRVSEACAESDKKLHHLFMKSLMKLPFTLKADIRKFNEELSNVSFFSKMDEYLGSIGGKDGKVVGNILNKLMSKELQGTLNWESIKSFKNILLLIYMASKKNWSSYSEVKANEVIINVLRNARSSVSSVLTK